MTKMRTFGTAVMLLTVAAGIWIGSIRSAVAHCDSINGPVIPEAMAALEKGDVTPILKWVKTGDEAEIRAAFAKAVTVRAKGSDAKSLADQYFLETFVRIHRAGEGAPYTGIKHESVEPIVAMADQALTDGSAEPMIKKINGHMATAIKERFERVVETSKRKNESVAAGREFVEAYVAYVHYVEGVHSAIASAGDHHADVGPSTASHKD